MFTADLLLKTEVKEMGGGQQVRAGVSPLLVMASCCVVL